MGDDVPHTILFRDVHLGTTRTEVLVVDGSVRGIGTALRPPAGAAVDVVEGDGGALVPGLHDHHVHLAALAAAMGSVEAGPPSVTTHEQLATALREADRHLPEGAWIRAVGYHESVAGDLDRAALDRLVPDRPVRVQHRTGMRWTLNSAALSRTRAHSAHEPGIERDAHGRPTGHVDRADDWLRRMAPGGFPDLRAVGRRLASLGITGVTDCTPFRDSSGPDALAGAVERGELPQAVHVTGGIELVDAATPSNLHPGPVKLVLDDGHLPELGALEDMISAAHTAGRPVAIHLVTASTLAFAIAAWDGAGARPGDRIEHGSVITPQAAERIAELGLTVVTQPGFVAERGDRYLVDVEPDEVAHLYRCGSLLRLGIPVAAGSDAPYTDPDPWLALRAATDRRTRAGSTLGPEERVPLERALDLFLGEPLDPGRGHRRVVVGAPADLCLLARPLHGGDGPPTAADVRATYRGGVRI